MRAWAAQSDTSRTTMEALRLQYGVGYITMWPYDKPFLHLHDYNQGGLQQISSLTFMTETMGSASSERMPTTDMTCRGEKCEP